LSRRQKVQQAQVPVGHYFTKSVFCAGSNADSCVTADSSTTPAQNAVQTTSSTSKLSLSSFLMPGRSKKANAQEHHNVELTNSAPSTSLPTATSAENAGKTSANDVQHSLGGFLKKHKHKRNSTSKKKGDSEIVEQNFQNLYVYFILFSTNMVYRTLGT
jgi:hypothetical protein